MAFNPRYAAYAASQGRTPETQLDHDRIAWPGGVMTGYVQFIARMAKDFEVAFPAYCHRSVVYDHQRFTAFVVSRAVVCACCASYSVDACECSLYPCVEGNHSTCPDFEFVRCIPSPEAKAYEDGDDLSGRLMCYRCRHSFPAPRHALYATPVTCLGCGAVDARYEHKCAEDDPLRHTSGWPYDDPTVDCDC